MHALRRGENRAGALGYRLALPCPIFTLQLFQPFPLTSVVVGLTPSVLGRLVGTTPLVCRVLLGLSSFILGLSIFQTFPFPSVVVGFTPSVLGRLVGFTPSVLGRLVVFAPLVGRRLVGTASLIGRAVVPPRRDKDTDKGNEGNQQRHATLRREPRKERLHEPSIEAPAPTNTPPAPVQRLKSRFPPACLHPEAVAVSLVDLPPQGFTPIHQLATCTACASATTT